MYNKLCEYKSIYRHTFIVWCHLKLLFYKNIAYKLLHSRFQIKYTNNNFRILKKILAEKFQLFFLVIWNFQNTWSI